jgi:prophage regulatory protein
MTDKTTNPQANNRFIRIATVTNLTGIPRSSVYALISRNLFPAQISLGGGKSVAWLESDVLAWMNERIAASKAA